MAEYIDRNDALAIARYAQDKEAGILNLPAADVVPVVRCKDCLYSDDSWAKVNEKGFLICPASGMEITDNDFCSYGERRVGDTNA